MSAPGTFRFPEVNAKPAAPPAGYALIYIKTDNVLYLQDSSGTEIALGSASAITQLTGDVTASGPGIVPATVVFVGGQTAADVASATLLALAATALNNASTIVRRDSSGNFAAGLITANLAGNATTATSALSFTGSLAGDVTGTQGATVVSLVGGSTAANVHAAELIANAATSANTSSAVVRRDASGNFSASVITANLTGIASNATLAVNFSGSLSGDVTGTQSATVVALVGGSSASNIHAAELLANAATSANTASAIVRRDASGDILVSHINGVVVEAHAARHLPSGADPLTTAAPLININANTANGVGTANSLARSDHQHAVDTGTPSSQTPDQANAPGTSPNLVRADHVHNIPTATAVDIGTANSQGAAATFSRADHVHRGVRSVKANSGAQRFGDLSLKNGVGATVTDDGAGNFTIDVTGGASELFATYSGSGLSVDYTAGKVIFNGVETFIAAGSIAVPPSTSNGYVYVNITGAVASGATLPPNTVPMAIFSTGLSSVTFLEDARVFLAQSLVWSLVGDIQTVSATAAKSAGIVEKYARGDHNHDILTGAPSTQNADQANATGASANLARADHIHNIPTDVPIQSNADGTNTQGSATKFSKADHKHDILVGTPSTQNTDQANAPGASSALSRTDHIHNIPTDVPVQIGTTNIQGASAKFSRADHVHQLTDAVTTARVLTGFAVGANTAIVAADSILSAFGKTQGQINSITASAITALTGDVLATGPGSVAATIAVGAVTDTKASLAVKPAVTVAATTNQALTGTPTIDGQATASGSLILLTAQTTGSENGPWVAAAGAWSRPTWYPAGGTTQAFAFITTFVRLGTKYGGSIWRQTAAAPITIDTTSTTWVVTATSGNYKSAFTLGPASGSADVQLNFANAFIGTLAWNPTASYQIKLPPTQGAAGTFPSNDGAGNLTWTNPVVNIDGGAANSNYTPSQLINGGTA